MMIDVQLVPQILKLHEAGCSGREIAKQVGVSKTTVQIIVKGKHCPRYKPKPETQSPYPPFEMHNRRYSRCHNCGGMVTQPCMLCFIRELKAEDKKEQSKKDRANAL